MSTDTENNTDTQSDSELGEAGKKAIAQERARADKAERQVRALEAQIQTFESTVSALEAEKVTLAGDLETKSKEITRLNVGIDKKLPKSLIDRLRGDDEDSLIADADALLEFVPGDTKQDPFPKADPSQGAKDKTGKTSNADLFAEQVGDF
jgi:uncharacterized membrane protein YqiK